MAKRKKKEYRWQDVIHRMKNSFYVNRWGMYLDEVRVVDIALAGFQIEDRKVLLMLKSFNFDVTASMKRIDEKKASE